MPFWGRQTHSGRVNTTKGVLVQGPGVGPAYGGRVPGNVQGRVPRTGHHLRELKSCCKGPARRGGEKGMPGAERKSFG